MCLIVSLEALRLHHTSSASWEAGLDSGVFGVVCYGRATVLCDWGITPVTSDDHIRICISGAQAVSQHGKDTRKHQSLAYMEQMRWVTQC